MVRLSSRDFAQLANLGITAWSSRQYNVRTGKIGISDRTTRRHIRAQKAQHRVPDYYKRTKRGYEHTFYYNYVGKKGVFDAEVRIYREQVFETIEDEKGKKVKVEVFEETHDQLRELSEEIITRYDLDHIGATRVSEDIKSGKEAILFGGGNHEVIYNKKNNTFMAVPK